ncbi:MAG: cytochrome P450 [Acidobacteriota bacterium]|nr:cytochrome P450 [Acidobacteriota bacterium]
MNQPANNDTSLSLYHLLDPAVLANPYPLYKRLREADPVHWDPFLHAWVATRYEDVVQVMLKFSADRTPSPEHLEAMGMMAELQPVAQLMVKQMLFMDAPAHTRLRAVCATAFTPARVAGLRRHIQEIADRLIDRALPAGRMDLIADFANPLPAIVTAELFGVPVEDHENLKIWSTDFAEMLGNFQHNPERARGVLKSTENMLAYFQDAIRNRERLLPGLVQSLIDAEVDGSRLTEEEVIANLIVTMVGGQETTTNLIGNGLVSLLRNPDQLELLKNDPSILSSGIEELLRFESPSQHTARMAPEDMVLGGKEIKKRQAVIAVFAAANRDPERFADPDTLDLRRPDNRHVAFAWGAHYCFGAPLARMEGRIAFETLLRRLPNLRLEPGELAWRENMGLRGLKSLGVSFNA